MPPGRIPSQPMGAPPPGPPAGPPAGAPPPGMEDKLNGMRSGFNPTDAGMDALDGKYDPNMTVIELLQAQGIDPQGPVSQLKDFFMKSMKNADPINKMRGLASAQSPGGAGVPGMPPAGPQQGAPPPGPPQGGVGPQFDKLMNR